MEIENSFDHIFYQALTDYKSGICKISPLSKIRAHRLDHTLYGLTWDYDQLLRFGYNKTQSLEGFLHRNTSLTLKTLSASQLRRDYFGIANEGFFNQVYTSTILGYQYLTLPGTFQVTLCADLDQLCLACPMWEGLHCLANPPGQHLNKTNDHSIMGIFLNTYGSYSHKTAYTKTGELVVTELITSLDNVRHYTQALIELQSWEGLD